MLSATAVFKYLFIFFIIFFIFICAIYYYLSQKRVSDRIGFSLKKKDWKSINNYIYTCGLTQNPSDLKTNSASAYEKHKLCDNLINYFIKKEFHNINQKRYYILADSGIGKTFFLYKLLIQYSMNLLSNYNVYYVNIESGNTDYLKKIEDIVGKTKTKKNSFELDKTILLIDGLENLWDSDIKTCYKSYQRLLLSTEDFYKVITTSTIRFFSKLDNDLSGLDDSNNMLISMLSSQKIYLPYFTDEDLSVYLKKMFSSNSKLREDITIYLKKRSYIVKSPLLLSYIDDLKGKNFPYFYRIHKTIVDKVLKFGQNESYQKLLSFCEDVATFLYDNNQTSINSDTLFSLMENNTYSILSMDDLLDGTKDLLVTYSAGSYKFVHQSFYEYFLSIKAMKDMDFRLRRDFSNLESADKFFNEMCKADIYKNKKAVFQKDHDYRGYDFSNVDFKDCNFAGVALDYCTFAYAKLTGAILNGANFHNANLSYVTAVNTNFEGANLDNTILDNVVLVGATGIDVNIINKINMKNKVNKPKAIDSKELEEIAKEATLPISENIIIKKNIPTEKNAKLEKEAKLPISEDIITKKTQSTEKETALEKEVKLPFEAKPEKEAKDLIAKKTQSTEKETALEKEVKLPFEAKPEKEAKDIIPKKTQSIPKEAKLEKEAKLPINEDIITKKNAATEKENNLEKEVNVSFNEDIIIKKAKGTTNTSSNNSTTKINKPFTTKDIVTEDTKPFTTKGIVTEDTKPFTTKGIVTENTKPFTTKGIVTEDTKSFFVKNDNDKVADNKTTNTDTLTKNVKHSTDEEDILQAIRSSDITTTKTGDTKVSTDEKDILKVTGNSDKNAEVPVSKDNTILSEPKDTKNIVDVLVSNSQEFDTKKVKDLNVNETTVDESQNSYNDISKIIVNRARKVSKKLAAFPDTIINKESKEDTVVESKNMKKATEAQKPVYSSEKTAVSPVINDVDKEISSTVNDKIVPKATTSSPVTDKTTNNKKANLEATIVDKPKTSKEPAISDKTKSTAEPTINDKAKSTAEPTINDKAKLTPEPTINDKAKLTPEPTINDKAKLSTEPTINDKAKLSTEPTINDKAKLSPEPTINDKAKLSTEPAINDKAKTITKDTISSNITDDTKKQDTASRIIHTVTDNAKKMDNDITNKSKKVENIFTSDTNNIYNSKTNNTDISLSATNYKDYDEEGYENGKTDDDASFEITIEKGGKSTKLDMAVPNHNQGLHPDNINTASAAELENIDLVKLFATQSIKEAEEIMLPTLNKLIKLHPDNSTYYYFKGRTLGKLNRHENALLELNSALIIEPDNVLYHYSKSVILYNLRRFEDALSEIELASISQPNNMKYHYFKTNILINLYQFKEALLEIDFCLSKDPTNAMYHHTRCVTLYALHRFKDALEEIDLAVASDPSNAMYRNTREELLSNTK